MAASNPPRIKPEIITPAAYERLKIRLNKQEAEAIQLARLEALARLMDAQFNIPFLPIPIGLDTLIGLIPGIGDTISLGVSSYIILAASRLGVPKRHLIRMGGNMLIDWVIGLVPIIGDIFDIGWRGNLRNVKIAREEIEKRWSAMN